MTTALRHGASAPLNDAQRIGRMVAGMAEVFGVTLTEARTRGYVEALRDVPVDALQAGIKHAIVTWRYPDMPKPADLRAAVDHELDARRELDEGVHGPAPRPVTCTNCEDNGWVVVHERTNMTQPVVRRCPCYQTNPRLVAPKATRYSESGEEAKRR